MAEHRKFRAACVQMRSGIDRSQNTDDALRLIAEAAKGGANFVTTPEMTNVVDRNPRRMFENLGDEEALQEISAFAGAAKEHNIWLLVGSMAVRASDDRAANRGFLFGPDGQVVARYDKLHMFDVDLPNGESWKESAVYQPGKCPVLVETELAKIGLTICYDVRFPKLYRTLAQAGAEVLCVPAAFTKQTGEAHWKTLLTARAIENGAFVIAPAQGGKHEDGRETYGHSLIIDPWGRVLAEAQNDEPGVIFSEIDLALAYDARQRIPNLTLEQSFEVSIVKP
ncbi:carbon-nitrogen hydrolase family protein [Hyphococcus lacteus]|uniref:Carbon-nitrogen hydrolase family protein n=1 Tax=Hyphococcus lacteus TaxID=3143536 RepID=A0ABV3Z3E6_9PROT